MNKHKVFEFLHRTDMANDYIQIYGMSIKSIKEYKLSTSNDDEEVDTFYLLKIERIYVNIKITRLYASS